MNGLVSDMVPNSTTPMKAMKTMPLTKLRSRKIANRTNGLSIVKECVKKK